MPTEQQEHNDYRHAASDDGSDDGDKTVIDRAAVWWTNRIFNDRELDHGILMCLLAIWILAFSDTLRTSTWWNEVFHVMPPAVWVFLLGGVGIARLSLSLSVSKAGHKKKKLASAALISCFVFGFMSFLVSIVRYEMSVTPLFMWLSYQSAKSYLRLSVSYRPYAHTYTAVDPE